MNEPAAFGEPNFHEFTKVKELVPAAIGTPAAVVELPWLLVRQKVPTLAPLYSRTDQITSTIALWASPDGDTYSLQSLGVGIVRFAAKGVLDRDYDVSAPLIDDSVGMVVNWSGEDTVEGVTETDAGALTLLAFIGGEIFSVRDVTIVSKTQVRLTGHRRAVFGTQRQTHVAGAEVLFLRRDQLRTFSDPFRYKVGSAWYWKMQPVWFNRTRPIEECDPLPAPAAILGTTCRPAPHVNLRVNGHSQNPAVVWGQNIVFEWDLADWRADAFWSLFSLPFSPWDTVSLIQVLDASGAIVRNFMLGVGVSNVGLRPGLANGRLGGTAEEFYSASLVNLGRFCVQPL